MMEHEVELLKLIEKNANLSVDKLAKLMGKKPAEIEEMIAHLEEKKAILGYSTLIDWAKVANEEEVTAMVDVKVTPARGVGFDKVAERIYRFPEVKAVYLMSGAYDLSVSVRGNTMMEIGRFISEKLSTLESVLSTTTHFVLKKYKHDGIILEDEDDDDKRIVVSP
ncbi:putative HTH-type transcriptional regulator YugG [Thalassobacillus devorans]|uniref:HTH-type transcriptional regulator YugG n=1 Tax=Thalassobacillus devorans TaxID=279813 RepID=A0ABQ1NJQ9_9BACI|nr:Lrp/AsnC family transcriptional regulator [Thalassobacillus devorans]NIK27504.1 DNA-binding Lrp family transcriptional regulator [Thalassobacillus devorans]GGC78234.1 putative HTH-type transcriptional regulator YugG [Thalassobacillus devorans]